MKFVDFVHDLYDTRPFSPYGTHFSPSPSNANPDPEPIMPVMTKAREMEIEKKCRWKSKRRR